MRVLRIISAGVFVVSAGFGGLQAQTLRNAQPPAEFPATSYKGKQYVDSRGCIYIRAGIDGNVTWIPRVSRNRKQVCGARPTATARVATPAAPPAKAPVIITNPAAVATPRVVTAAPAPKPTAKPAATVVVAQPKPVVQARPVVRRTTTVAAPRRRAAPAPAPAKARVRAPTVTGSCPNASAFSQRFINKPGGQFAVRCGPQREAPVTYGRGEKHSAVASPPVAIAPGTRVVRRHIWDQRQNTNNVSVPSGYRPVWTDDRLNPNRAERTLQAARVQNGVRLPAGYRRLDWSDDRLSQNRRVRTARGEAQSDRIWTRTTPRTLAAVPTQAQVVTVPAGRARAQDPQTVVRSGSSLRLSTRSAPATSQSKRRYVRVATYASKADARAVAKALARTGLPMQLARGKSSGRQMVLAGPFASDAQAKAALRRVQGAGYRSARLN